MVRVEMKMNSDMHVVPTAIRRLEADRVTVFYRETGPPMRLLYCCCMDFQRLRFNFAN